ncbi:hypothetical protein [Paraburkholderia caribensis]|uniref:hypothetical protein n=1 Tax=Paraburkholderia caribensis TaxID=75105 RepID=UPI0034D34404
MSTEQEHLEALAFCATVDVIRAAQGKPHPRDLPQGSAERMQAEIDVIRDAFRMLGLDPDAFAAREG